jgi:hypothetical protein
MDQAQVAVGDPELVRGWTTPRDHVQPLRVRGQSNECRAGHTHFRLFKTEDY